MISNYEAYVDGIALSSVDPTIYVLNIQPRESNRSITTVKVAGRAGSRVVKKSMDSTGVDILFEIHEYNMAKRQAICQKVQSWANGSVLMVSDRPDQQLTCVCDKFPKANAKEWTEPLSVGFISFNPPYWQELNETIVTVTNADVERYIPGNAPEALVSCTVTASSSLSSITLQAGETSITLSNISVSANDVIYLTYDDNNILHITKNGESILDKRTADSADDLKVDCGDINVFSVTTSGSVSAVFKARGCWY